MTTIKNKKAQEKAYVQTSEVKELDEKVSTTTSEVAKITLDEYLQTVKVNPGLVASFKTEARRDASLLAHKTEDGWKAAFTAQSTKVYK